MRCTPSASATVTTAGRPSGTAATARLTAPRKQLERRGAAQRARARTPRRDDREARPRASRRPTASSRAGAASRRPTRVSSSARDAADLGAACPSRTTSARPVPLTTLVPRNTMLRRSASGASRGEGAGALLDGLRLAGERRLVRAERRGLDEARVGGDEVARLEHEQVAAHDLARRTTTVARRARRARAARSAARARRPRAPRGAPGRSRARRSGPRSRGSPRRRGARRATIETARRREQQPDDEARELPREDRERVHGTRALQLVRAVGREAARGFRVGQTTQRIGGQRVGDGGGIERMPRERRLRGGHLPDLLRRWRERPLAPDRVLTGPAPKRARRGREMVGDRALCVGEVARSLRSRTT